MHTSGLEVNNAPRESGKGGVLSTPLAERNRCHISAVGTNDGHTVFQVRFGRVLGPLRLSSTGLGKDRTCLQEDFLFLPIPKVAGQAFRKRLCWPIGAWRISMRYVYLCLILMRCSALGAVFVLDYPLNILRLSWITLLLATVDVKVAHPNVTLISRSAIKSGE